MQPRTPPLWDAAARKEAFELLEHLWVTGDDQVRDRLTAALAAGPPDQLGDSNNAEQHQASRDRRVYDRIGVLARDNQGSLPSPLVEILKSIRDRYPQWTWAGGERAKFGTWMESWSGPATDHTPEDLRAIEDTAQLIELLILENGRRDGLLESWRQLVASDSSRGISVLEQLAARPGGGPADVWRTTLWGLRGDSKDSSLRDRLISLVSAAPPDLFNQAEFSRAVADVLEAASSGSTNQPIGAFWDLFDRALSGAENDPANRDVPAKDRWVDTAINRSFGVLAGAFFNALFTYRLQAGQGVPEERLVQLNRLIGIRQDNHRFARVIAASRLPYLHAVDPAWTKDNLLPSFDWSNEDEAMAVWQGFAWHPRVSPDLWTEIRQPFIAAFTQDRLLRFGPSARTMAQLLMLAGVEFRGHELPTEQTRSAIRAMSEETRDDALWWIGTYLSQESGREGASPAERVDMLWRDRVQPWLKRVWPRDVVRMTNTAERFALMAIATSDAFPEAVTFVEPFLTKTNAGLILSAIDKSKHPESHPAETLRLMEASVDPDFFWMMNDGRRVLDRIAATRTELRDDPAFRVFAAKVRINAV